MSGYLREAAVIEGVAAHVLDRVLASPNVAQALSGLPAWMQPELKAARHAIHQAAREYVARPVAANGSAETAVAEVERSWPDEIGTLEASALLGVTPRRVRQLAAGGLGRQVGGRWLIDRTAVEAYALKRRSG